MRARTPARGLATLIASACALACSVPATAATPAYPPFPTSIAVPDVAAWLRDNTNVDLGAVVGISNASVFSLEPAADAATPPIVRSVIRQEVINEDFARQMGGRTIVMTADVDCTERRVFQRSLDLYAGNNKQGAVRAMGAGLDWADVPPGTFINNAVAALCDADYLPIFPAGQVPTEVASAPGAINPRSVNSLQPVMPAQPRLQPVAPTRPAPAPAAARPPAPAPAPAPVVAAPAPAPAPTPPPPPPPPPRQVVATAPPSPDGPVITRPPLPAPAPAAVASAPDPDPAPTPVIAPPAPPPAADLPTTPPAPVVVAQAPAPPPAAPVRLADPAPVLPPAAAATPAPVPTPARAQAEAPAARTEPPPARPAAPAPAAPSASALGLRPLALARAEIGIYPTADAAIAAWREIAAAFPQPMGGKRQRIELTTAGDATRFRAFVDGFASITEATAFCRTLSGQGRACTPAE
jgi:hypothetical protein